MLLASACVSTRKLALVHHVNPVQKAEQLVQSLRTDGIDTIISYQELCSGCIKGTLNHTYVYWVKNGVPYVTTFNEVSTYDTLSIWFGLEFLAANLDGIASDQLKTVEDLSRFNLQKLNIILGKTVIDYEVALGEYRLNHGTYRVLLIDKFRSYLFGVQTSRHGWRALDYRFENNYTKNRE